MGKADLFLGLAIQRDRVSRTLTVSQRRMIEEVVAEYGMSSARSKSVPMSPGTRLVKVEIEERLDAELYPYSALVGSLLYIAGCTRPDISQAVGVLTRHMSAPGKEHWKAAKEVVRYLAGTAEYGLVFGGSRVDEGLLGYSDADHAGCVDTRRSTSGVVFFAARSRGELGEQVPAHGRGFHYGGGVCGCVGGGQGGAVVATAFVRPGVHAEPHAFEVRQPVCNEGDQEPGDYRAVEAHRGALPLGPGVCGERSDQHDRLPHVGDGGGLLDEAAAVRGLPEAPGGDGRVQGLTTWEC